MTDYRATALEVGEYRDVMRRSADWEALAEAHRIPATPEQAKRLIGQLAREHEMEMPTVKFTSRGWAFPGQHRINLPRSPLDPADTSQGHCLRLGAVLHEFAHLLADPAINEEARDLKPWHGQIFVDVLDDLVSEYTGPNARLAWLRSGRKQNNERA